MSHFYQNNVEIKIYKNNTGPEDQKDMNLYVS